MNQKTDIPLRLMIVASNAARRAALGHLISAALNGRVHITLESNLSLDRFAGSKSEILVADLEDGNAATALLDFLEDAPASAGSIALIDDPESGWVRRSLATSINAIMARDADGTDLQLAVQAAEAGLVLLHPSSVRDLAINHSALEMSLDTENSLDGLRENLTARESEVLLLVSAGLGNKEIAARLAISDHTVKFHISSILGKLHAASRTEAVSVGIRRGLIPI